MTIKELAIHFTPDFPVKLRKFETGEIIEEEMAGYFQDSKDWFYSTVEVKDWTMYRKHLCILI